MDYEQLFGLFLGGGILILLLTLIVIIGLYVLKSIAIMKCLNARGYENAWMAWLPIVDIYAWASSVYSGQETVPVDIINQILPAWLFQWQIPVIFVGQFIIALLPVIGMLSFPLTLVANFFLFGQLYKDTMRSYGIEVSVVEQVVVVIIPLVAYIRLLGASK